MADFFESGVRKMRTRNKIAYLVRITIYTSIIIYCLIGSELAFDLCSFKVATGLECYTCGLTRAFMNTFRLNFTDAINLNPLVIIAVPAFLLIIIDDVSSLIYNLVTKKYRPSFVGYYFGA